MKLSNINIKIKDGGIGKYSLPVYGHMAVIGVSSLPSSEAVLISRPSDIEEKLGYGMLANEIEDILAINPVKVYAMSIPENTQADNKANYREEKSNQSSGSINIGGRSLEKAHIHIEIVQTGDLGKAIFYYQYKHKRSESMLVPSNGQFSIPNTGLTLNFLKGNTDSQNVVFSAGDKFYFQFKKDPIAEDKEYFNALKNILNSRLDIEFIVFVGASGATLWSLVSNRLELAASKEYQYLFAIFHVREIEENENRDDYLAYLKAERRIVQSKRSVVLAQSALCLDNHGNTNIKIPIGIYSALISSLRQDEPSNEVNKGPISHIIALHPDNMSQIEIETIGGLNYTGFRRFIGLNGIYVSESFLLTDETSDYNFLERIRVMNKVCKLLRSIQIQFLNSNLIINEESGKIENLVHFLNISSQPLEEMKVNNEISNYQIICDEEQDVLHNNKIDITVKILPVGKVKYIENVISYYAH